ncbi:hypothetical protein VTO73DRAFT_10172 [Trametes versicolor]
MQRRRLRYALLAPKFGTTPYEGREPPGHLTVDGSTQDSGLPCQLDPGSVRYAGGAYEPDISVDPQMCARSLPLRYPACPVPPPLRSIGTCWWRLRMAERNPARKEWAAGHMVPS